MKKFCALLMFVVVLSSLAFSQKDKWNKGFEFGLKYENYSYASVVLKDFDLVNVNRYDWHMTTKLRRLQGEESVSRILFLSSYSSPIFRLTAIVGVGNIAHNYYQGTIQQRETIIGWSGKAENNYELFPIEKKSDLGLVFGGEFNWKLKSDPLTISLNARYLWQEQTRNESNLFYDFGEGFAYMQYGYHLQRVDIQKTSWSEISLGVNFSKKFGNWILCGGPMAVFLETIHKGVGHWENRFQNFLFNSYDSFRSNNDFTIKINNQGFFLFYHLGYEVNFAEMFIEGRVGFANGVSAGLNFKLF